MIMGADTPVTYMNWSADDVVLITLGVVTLISTVPVVLTAGAVTESEVVLINCRLVADVLPKVTAVTPINPVPVMVTVVPPANRPRFGDTPVTVGADTPVK